MAAPQGPVKIVTTAGEVELQVERTAVLVIDMQNDFGDARGMFGRAGVDLSGITAAVEPTAKVLDAARRTGLRIVYLKMGFLPDLSDLGGPESPNRIVHDRLGVGTEMIAPDGRTSRILVRDTWNTDILPALSPMPDDEVIYKSRYSGFYRTGLEASLRAHDIRTLVLTGCTTSVCVESTMRDAMFRDLTCVLLSDCTAEPIGARNHDSSLDVLGTMFGHVSDSAAFVAATTARPSELVPS
ncbi:cysteine hydrolase [Amnibacterium sp.]|uniref:cysteine hydrolase n=1 Tax=Amnibacterium sp. TaxID=1872496 RepID=UPI00262861AA|nr:cysteine hydrolase [Amnibacterium sp.]MCU1473214.1 rutB 1 [Amnibacterium sp.]